MTLCCDTHPLIWYACDQRETLSRHARDLLSRCASHEHQLIISTMVVLEAFHAGLKKKDVQFKLFVDALRTSRAQIVPFDAPILKACYRLPENLNIHDRVIAATALVHHCPLITKDARLRELQIIETIW